MQGVRALFASNELSRYDIIFGFGVDPSTRRYMLLPSASARIIFYTPSGSDTGPTNLTVSGVTYSTYTRRLMSGCQSLMRNGIGDWVLFPATTITIPVNGETVFGTGSVKNLGGASMTYPTVFGTYNPAAMTDSSQWNKTNVTLDYSALNYSVATSLFYDFPAAGTVTNAPMAFLNFTTKAGTAISQAPFYQNTGAHVGLLFERCVWDGTPVTVQTAGTQTYGASVTLTSSGTTATAACSTAFAALIKAASDASQTVTMQVYGATGATTAYNGSYVVTYVDTTHFSYTFAGTGGVAAIGSTFASIRFDLMPDILSTRNVVFNQCGTGYCGKADGSHAIGIYCGGPLKHLRLYNVVDIHGGWPRQGSRSAGVWNPGTTNVTTSLTQSGGTVTCLTPNTGALAVGSYVLIGGGVTSSYNVVSQITALTPNVSFTYQMDVNGAPAVIGGASINGYLSGNTLTVSSTSAGAVATGQVIVAGGGVTSATITAKTSSTTFTFSGSAQNVGSAGSPIAVSLVATWADPTVNGWSGVYADPPDIFSHGLYFDQGCIDVKTYDDVCALSCIDTKYTGGPYYVENRVDFRNPMSLHLKPSGNDATGYSWPANTAEVMVNHLQAYSVDATPGLPRSLAPEFQCPGNGSLYSNGLLLNASNLSGTNRTGVGASNITDTGVIAIYPGVFDMQHSIMSSWGATTVGAESQLTRTFEFNITDDSTVLAGGTNLLVSSTRSAFQTALTASKAKDIANTFRAATPELAGVTVVPGNDAQTEQNCFDYMMYHPEINWARKIQAHWRQPIGR